MAEPVARIQTSRRHLRVVDCDHQGRVVRFALRGVDRLDGRFGAGPPTIYAMVSCPAPGGALMPLGELLRDRTSEPLELGVVLALDDVVNGRACRSLDGLKRGVEDVDEHLALRALAHVPESVVGGVAAVWGALRAEHAYGDGVRRLGTDSAFR